MSRPATVDDVICRRRPAHEMRADLAALWRDGFHAGAEAARQRLATLEVDANYWYWRATDPEAHAARMRAILAGFDAQTARNAQARRWAALDAAEREHAHAR